jgi:hypothetical protein
MTEHVTWKWNHVSFHMSARRVMTLHRPVKWECLQRVSIVDVNTGRSIQALQLTIHTEGHMHIVLHLSA